MGWAMLLHRGKIRPFVFAIADEYYGKTFAPAFLNSAHAFGHEAHVHIINKTMGSKEDRANIAMERFRMLPALLEKHPHVLMMDVDSIFKRPVDIEPTYDLGIFLRANTMEERYRVLCSIFYCTANAMDFAKDVAAGTLTSKLAWCDDQVMVWRTYQRMGHNYRIKQFGRETLDWEPKTNAPVFTAKGPLLKTHQVYQDALQHWTNKPTGAPQCP